MRVSDLDDLAAVLDAARVDHYRDAYSLAAGMVTMARHYLATYEGPLRDEIDELAAACWLTCSTPLRLVRPRPPFGFGRVSNLRAVIVSSAVREYADARRSARDVAPLAA